MARITDIYLVGVPAENALVINGKGSVSEIPGFIEDAFMKLEEYIKGSGEIENYGIPAGKRIFRYWLGDNSEMLPLHDEMVAFAKESGYEVEEGFFGYFLNSPGYGSDKLLTKVVMFLLD